MELIIIFIIIVFLVLLAIFMYTWYRIHTALHVHVSENQKEREKYSLPYQTRFFKTSDGIKIASWYIPVKNPKAIVILLHGYFTADGGKSMMLSHAKYLWEAGYSTLLIDLRASGESEGSKITLGVNEWKDAEAAYEYMKALPENKDKKIGFFGISMGATVALLTAGLTRKGDFVIASVPYASLNRQLAFNVRKEHLYMPIFFPMLKLASLIELGIRYEQYSPLYHITNIHVPLFIIQAKNDDYVTSIDAKLLYDKAHQPKEFWSEDTTHDVFKYKPIEGKKRVLNFLEKYIE